MQIEVKLDDTYKELKVLVLSDKLTDEVNNIVKKLNDSQPHVITGFRGEYLEIIEPQKIVRAYAANQKVFVKTAESEYTVRARLYELEERLDKAVFVRISNSEIINLKKVKGFDLSLSGTICVKFIDGATTYASRRYVTKIKQILGV